MTSSLPFTAPVVDRNAPETLTLPLKDDLAVAVTLSFTDDFHANRPSGAELQLTRALLNAIFTQSSEWEE